MENTISNISIMQITEDMFNIQSLPNVDLKLKEDLNLSTSMGAVSSVDKVCRFIEDKNKSGSSSIKKFVQAMSPINNTLNLHVAVKSKPQKIRKKLKLPKEFLDIDKESNLTNPQNCSETLTHLCSICNLNFSTKGLLVNHQERLHQMTEKSEKEGNVLKKFHKSKDYMCEQCGKQFVVKANLIGHLRIHRGERPYKCDLCGQTFTHPNSLVGHRRIHTGERPYICNFCGKGYRVKHQLSSHLIVHSDVRPFKCDICPRTFRSRSNLRVHKDEHEGIKRFTCSYCDRKFLVRGNMLKHVRRHIGERPHKCETCGKAFIEKQELRNHMRTHKGSEDKTFKKLKSKTINTNIKPSSTTEKLPLTSTVSADTRPVSTENSTNILPVMNTVNVSYFANNFEVANQEQIPVILPSQNSQMVLEEIPIENVTFAAFIRSQLQVPQISLENLNSQSLIQEIKTAPAPVSLGQKDISIQRGCKLCKQHFLNPREHLVEYHRLVLDDYDDIETYLF